VWHSQIQTCPNQWVINNIRKTSIIRKYCWKLSYGSVWVSQPRWTGDQFTDDDWIFPMTQISMRELPVIRRGLCSGLIAEAPPGTPNQNRTLYSIFTHLYVFVSMLWSMWKSIFKTVSLSKNSDENPYPAVDYWNRTKTRGKIAPNEQCRDFFLMFMTSIKKSRVRQA
jgi:hypothetical protein